MSTIVCPICLGQRFVEYRGRPQAQCASCDSLERHRLFKLFLLWVTPARSRLVLSSVGPLETLGEYEDWLTVSRLLDENASSQEPESMSDTCVFLENVVGLRDVDEEEKSKIRECLDLGALIAFSCHSGFEERRVDDVGEMLGSTVEYQHFDPRKVYGENVSDEFGLNLSKKLRGKGDIFFFCKHKDNVELLSGSNKDYIRNVVLDNGV